ncbi:MAG: 3'(2'),5'-bisphosphate nucleotidase CysQ [Gallionella sp.]|nr:3'(2'),5'-bisphosphate nucleotidase CysQ [Gallionella sp.]MDD4946171.1 3'(2'),5'-bisphosphate nucleotidase CysQ [Gallionella sp.]
MNNLLNEVVMISRMAGSAIMEKYLDPDNQVSSKSDNSPLTAADLAADAAINSGITSLGYDWPMLSEESSKISFNIRKQWGRYWLIDPLDGTKEFIRRNGEFTVNIALIEKGIPILGVVYAPAMDVCYFAAVGVGAFVRRNGEVKKIKTNTQVEGELLKVVSSRSHSDARTEALLEKLGECFCVSMGSSLKLCLVAEGLADFYPRLGPTMEWDTAAAHAIVSCAGGRVCDSDGVELNYNKSNLHNPEFFVLPRGDEKLLDLVRS